MMRALSSSWRGTATLTMAMLLVAMTATSAFAGKPTVAILGLEVIDASGNIDQTSTTVAHDLTEGLRSRAKVPSGPYQLQPGSDKELIDEKLLKNCDTEGLLCMTDIGKDLGADYLIYGRLEKKPEGYVVTINLLNVGKKKFEKAKTPLVISYNQKDSTAIAANARKAYNDLTGVSDLGTLVVRTNAGVDRGSVLLDDAQRGTLSSGSATIKDLAEGRYRLVVEADGWQRSKETTVTIRSGETTTMPITLVEKLGTGPERPTGPLIIGKTGSVSDDGGKGWHKVAWISGIATGGLGLAYAFTWNRLRTTGKKTGPDADFLEYGANCSIPVDANNRPVGPISGPGYCKSGSTYQNLTYITGIGMGIGLGFTAFAIIKSFTSKDERPPAGTDTIGRRTRPRRNLSVTPVLSPDGGGATVQFDW